MSRRAARITQDELVREPVTLNLAARRATLAQKAEADLTDLNLFTEMLDRAGLPYEASFFEDIGMVTVVTGATVFTFSAADERRRLVRID